MNLPGGEFCEEEEQESKEDHSEADVDLVVYVHRQPRLLQGNLQHRG